MPRPILPAGAELRALIAAKAATPEGYRASDARHLPNYKQSARTCERMTEAGLLHPAKVETHGLRHFSTAAAAERFMAGTARKTGKQRLSEKCIRLVAKLAHAETVASAKAVCDSIRDNILTQAATPKGFAIGGHKTAQYHCNVLLAAGVLHRARVNMLLVRYFTTAEAAAAFLTANPWASSKTTRHLRPSQPKPTKLQQLQVVQRKAYSPPAPKRDAVAVYPEHYRKTVHLMGLGRYEASLPMVRMGSAEWRAGVGA